MIKTKIVYKFIGIFLIFFCSTLSIAEVDIKGKVNVHGHEMHIWKEYLKSLQVSLDSSLAGEDLAIFEDNSEKFGFNSVNSEANIQVGWTHEHSTINHHVLFPFDFSGKASSLKNGTIKFSFRGLDWVLTILKQRATRASIRGKLDEITKIATNAHLYYNSLIEASETNPVKLARYKYSLLRHICQILSNERAKDRDQFNSASSIKTQRTFYLDLLVIASKSEYQQKFPGSFVRALNEWIIFSKQAYSKNGRWSDRDMPFNGEIDRSLGNKEYMNYLQRDVIKISQLLKIPNPKIQLQPNPFNKSDSVNMNEVGNWVLEKNREMNKR